MWVFVVYFTSRSGGHRGWSVFTDRDLAGECYARHCARGYRVRLEREFHADRA